MFFYREALFGWYLNSKLIIIIILVFWRQRFFLSAQDEYRILSKRYFWIVKYILVLFRFQFRFFMVYQRERERAASSTWCLFYPKVFQPQKRVCIDNILLDNIPSSVGTSILFSRRHTCVLLGAGPQHECLSQTVRQ